MTSVLHHSEVEVQGEKGGGRKRADISACLHCHLIQILSVYVCICACAHVYICFIFVSVSLNGHVCMSVYLCVCVLGCVRICMLHVHYTDELRELGSFFYVDRISVPCFTALTDLPRGARVIRTAIGIFQTVFFLHTFSTGQDLCLNMTLRHQAENIDTIVFLLKPGK